ncbi:conserved Plasmodium protein, unknown function [Plasmodium relictum]|uniref:Uncharacterized protein n=1 Tax=Plasmodium relictum TaxID=85471 RepID=A0A1J1HC92_PLARL|nr:conserved Plasmodium protein, unknown function [Plasmodium relictum]CRH01193.1 conserved Plasmodium protein, unknown function [Plasmodium relictum]
MQKYILFQNISNNIYNFESYGNAITSITFIASSITFFFFMLSIAFVNIFPYDQDDNYVDININVKDEKKAMTYLYIQKVTFPSSNSEIDKSDSDISDDSSDFGNEKINEVTENKEKDIKDKEVEEINKNEKEEQEKAKEKEDEQMEEKELKKKNTKDKEDKISKKKDEEEDKKEGEKEDEKEDEDEEKQNKIKRIVIQ